MSEHDDEREAGRRYRELPREEPPPALDAKIRAEARRAAVTHPAPLVAPTGRRNWYFPVAAAAVIVLAVAVTWQVEREQGDEGEPPASPPAAALRKEQNVPEQAPQKKAQPEEAKNQAPASAAGTLSQSREDALRERENRMRQERPSSGIAAAPAPQRQDEVQPQARAKAAEEPPDKWLERIAQLRREGRHDEADKALAEFRKRYPDYRIPEAMLEKVEKK
jgi:Meckel syndrome type 1 protein